jgi:hypothetical protein
VPSGRNIGSCPASCTGAAFEEDLDGPLGTPDTRLSYIMLGASVAYKAVLR